MNLPEDRSAPSANEIKLAGELNQLSKTIPPCEEIIKVARERGVDLIIIATHGYTGLKHFLLGSTTERVVRIAPCPVLVVRQEEQDFVS
jgi:universal stress protein A